MVNGPLLMAFEQIPFSNIQLFTKNSNGNYDLNQSAFSFINSNLPEKFSTKIPIDGEMETYHFRFRPSSFFQPRVILSSGDEHSTFAGNQYEIFSPNGSEKGKVYFSDQLFILRIQTSQFHYELSKNLSDYSGLNFLKNPIVPGESQNMACQALDEQHITVEPKMRVIKNGGVISLNLYFEIDHSLFLSNNADVETTMIWINNHKERVAALFSVHNIAVNVAEVFVWDTPDIYQGINETSVILETFGQRIQNNFDGQVAQLLTSRIIGGGLAHIDKLCQPYSPQDHTGPYSVAGNIDITDVLEPAYNFSTYVSAHEIGHVLGSPHTHACAWGPSSNEAIDNCFAVEGNCSPGNYPSNGGSVMSYCFMSPAGINFDIGFGQEPGSLIYNNLINASCLTSCTAGEICDDGDACTTSDQYDSNCNCIGILIDINNNNECDLNETCEPEIYMSVQNGQDTLLASRMISSTVAYTNNNPTTIYSASNEIHLNSGFEIPLGKPFAAYQYGCDDDSN